jgi:hypothetical protein
LGTTVRLPAPSIEAPIAAARGGGLDSVGERNDYGDGPGGDFDNSCGLIFHREAAGVVEAIGPSVETTGADTRIIYQGDVIVGKLAMGAAPVRVSVAGEFRNT